jgi:glutathione S-transferase
MYDEVKVFLKALGKRKFLGGKQPNLADLVMLHIFRVFVTKNCNNFGNDGRTLSSAEISIFL